MSDEFVLLRHNVTGAPWLCPAGVVREWAAMGWEPVTDEAPADPEPAPATPAPKSRGTATPTPTEES